MAIRYQMRRDLSSEWEKNNPILADGELGYETDTKKRKIGDGVTPWNDLDYTAAENIAQKKGHEKNVVMSQDAVTKEFDISEKHLTMPFDRIEAVATVKPGSAVGDVEVIYDTSTNKFVFLATDGNYYRSAEVGNYYNETVNGPIRKDKIFVCKNRVYIYNKETKSLSNDILKNTENPFIDNPSNPNYSEDVAFLGVDIPTEKAFFQVHGGYIYIVPEDRTLKAKVKYNMPNGTPLYLEVYYSDYENVPVGSIIGCVILSNKENLSTKETTATPTNIYCDIARKNYTFYNGIKKEIELIINGHSDILVTKENIDYSLLPPFNVFKKEQDSKHTKEPYNKSFYGIAEMYIRSELCYYENNKGYTLRSKPYGGNIYVQMYNQNTDDIEWKGIADISSKKNNFAYPILCTIEGKNTSVKIGDVIGYVLCDDVVKIANYKSDYSKDYSELSMSFVTSISNFPLIIESLKEQNRPVPQNDGITICLPDEIRAVVGDTLQLYYKSIFRCVTPYIYDINVLCDIGAQYPRYYEVTPTEPGVHDITFIIKNNNNEIINKTTLKIRISDKGKNPAPLNVLCVGASATAGGEWVNELKRRLVESGGKPEGSGFANINFVGRLTSSSGVKLEATGGYNFDSYVSNKTLRYRFYFDNDHLPQNIRIGDVYESNGSNYTIAEINIPSGNGGNISCDGTKSPQYRNPVLTRVNGTGDVTLNAQTSTQVGNPFVFDGVINIKKYADEYCGGKIDVVCTECFGNGLPVYANTEQFAYMLGDSGSLTRFIKQFKDAFPNVKFCLGSTWCPDEKGGVGANYGANGHYSLGYGMKYSKMNLLNAVKKYIKERNVSNYVYSMDWMNEFDSENNFIQRQKAVNVRSTKTETFGENGVHPTIVGYNQMADTAWRLFVTKFCQ